MKDKVLFERGDKLYIVGPVAPMAPTAEQVEEFAFADEFKELRKVAPNEHIAWFAGHYVEGDIANRNGAMWTGEEIAIKSLTPMHMPVTVMHDPRTAVGSIVDVALRLPEKEDVPRAKIETALALWKHRFGDIVEEAQANYEQGTLMQSMECFAPNYSCSTCGMTYHKLRGGKEEKDWCAHLKASKPHGGYMAAAGGSKETQTAVRILRNVCFTGTGLIFGTRGAKGADPSANLEALEEEVASFHERAHTDTKPRRKRKPMSDMEISAREYQELKAAEAERDRLKTEKADLESDRDAQKQRADDAEHKVEQEETAKKAAEKRATDAEAKVQAAEDEKGKASLAKERLDKLGAGFKEKLGDFARQRLESQAREHSEDEWTARIQELEEITGVQADEKGDEGDSKPDDTFTAEETARHQGGSGDAPSGPAKAAETSAVVGGLFGA